MMLEFCFATQLPCHVLLTKADKISRGQAAQALASLRKELAASGTAGHGAGVLFVGADGRG